MRPINRRWPRALWAVPVLAGFLNNCVSDAQAPSGSAPDAAAAVSDAGNDGGRDTRNDAAGEPREAPAAPSGVAVSAVPINDVTTLAGSGATLPYADGTGPAATFNNPYDVAVDAAANVYVIDAHNARLRKVTPAGVVTTLAGSGNFSFADGTGANASFTLAYGVAATAGGTVYVADTYNQRIRQVSALGVVTTLVGDGDAATLNLPMGIAVQPLGDIYIGDTNNNRIRRVKPPGSVTTVAGSGASTPFAEGPGTTATFNSPQGIAVDAAGNVYVADTGNHRIRAVTPAGVVSTLAGSGFATFAEGTGAAASFNTPRSVALDSARNVYVADTANHRIRKVTPAGVVTTVAGTGAAGFGDGAGATANFQSPFGVAVDSAGSIYVADTYNNRIRKITSGIGALAVTWSATTTAGSSAITGYAATASASGHATQACTTAGGTSCTIGGLTSGIVYSVSVTASNAAGTSPPSPSAPGIPN